MLNRPLTNYLNYTANYVLDLVGNRLSKTTTYPSYPTEVITYAYDHGDGVNSDDRLMTETATSGGNAEYSTSYGYDANGSMTSLTRTGQQAQTGVYVYDLQNRLQSSTINSTTTTYGYDAASNRISEKTGSTSTYYLIDNNNPSGYSQTLQESSTLGGTPTTTYTLGNRVLAQANSAGTTLYLMPDGQGSTRLITDVTGTIKAHYDYDAFGTAADFNMAGALTKYLYDGQQYDSGAGQYDLRARYYQSSTGRFSSMDSRAAGAGDTQNANLYLYVGVNPIGLHDPTGHQGVGDALAVVGLAAMIVGLGTMEFIILNENHFFSGNTLGMTGGPEVTTQLQHLRQAAFARWNSASPAQRQHVISSMSLPNPGVLFDWDINEFYGSDNKEKFGSGPGQVPTTVTVNDNVFYVDDVNYYLYGIIARLTDMENGDSGDAALQNALDNVELYRKTFWVGTNITQRQAWVRAGYYGDFDQATYTSLQGVVPSVDQYTGSLTAHFGPKGSPDEIVVSGGLYR